MLRIVLCLLSAALCGGCYYAQAVSGQWELTRKREPIAEVLERDDTPPELAARLRLVRDARRFAVDELALPDNGSYRSYADLGRDYVVWNVYAAPEFSIEPKSWCYPVAGCVSYRGYFAKHAADRAAERLAADGYDVAVGGVAAYSTLGRLKDPVLNTMMRWDDVQLVAVLFHELAHQLLYVKGDSGFNESFATAVEEAGVERWFRAQGREDAVARHAAARRLRQDLMALVASARHDLQRIYDAGAPDDARRRDKRTRLEQLASQVNALLEHAGRDSGHWLARDLNNARLASMALYEGRLPAFRALLRACGEDLRCFYAAAERLAGLPREERDARLDALTGGELQLP